MKFIWIIFITIAIQEIICNKITKNKKELVVYCSIVLISVILCMIYYSNEYSQNIIRMVDSKFDLERIVWIK